MTKKIIEQELLQAIEALHEFHPTVTVNDAKDMQFEGEADIAFHTGQIRALESVLTIMKQEKLKWVIEVAIAQDAVADGCDLSTHDKVKTIIERAYPMLAGTDTEVEVLVSPNPKIIAALQGYDSVDEYRASIW